MEVPPALREKIRAWNHRRLDKHNVVKKRKLAEELPFKINNWLLLHTLAEYKKSGVTSPKIHFDTHNEICGGNDFLLRREKNRLVILRSATTIEHEFHVSLNKIAAATYWLTQADPSIESVTINASDGNYASTARYAYSTADSNVIALPDPHFFRDHGYAETDIFAKEQASTWQDRSDKIIWRGAVNNEGLFSINPKLQDNLGIMQRMRFAMKAKELGIDFRFVAQKNTLEYGILKKNGYLGSFVPTNDWAHMKFAIDIDGYTNAWCNLLQRLKLGCCVLKVDSQFGFKQWYYDQLTPMKHYVPVKADLSNLAQQVDWLRENPDHARDIAANGQAFAKELTFKSETITASEIIYKAGNV